MQNDRFGTIKVVELAPTHPFVLIANQDLTETFILPFGDTNQEPL